MLCISHLCFFMGNRLADWLTWNTSRQLTARNKTCREIFVVVVVVVVAVVAVAVPGREGLEVVVGHVEHAEVCVASEQRDTLVRQPVVSEIELLEDTVALL